MSIHPEMRVARFWCERIENAEAILMSAGEIDAFNRKMLAGAPSLVDLDSLPGSLSRDQIANRLLERSLRPEARHYDHQDKPLHDAFWDTLEAEIGLSQLPAEAALQRGFTVRRCLLRRFPTDAGIFKRPGEPDLDRNIETAAGAVEPLALLWQSQSRDWCFVQIYNYTGWVRSGEIALCAPGETPPRIERPGEFLTILADRAYSVFNPLHPGISRLALDMGQQIRLLPDEETPLEIDGQATEGNYAVQLPQRQGREGRLWMQPALIPGCADICHGYPPFCRAKIVEQAFKCLGQRYGWGGMYEARDCASLIQDVFRCFGLRLPRNAGQQGRMDAGRFTPFPEGMPEAERRRLLVEQVPPGAALYMDGHVLLYLGTDRGEPYALQDVYEYFQPQPDGSKTRQRVNQVMVTNLNLFRETGQTFLEALYGARDFVG